MDEIRDSVFTANLQPLSKDSIDDVAGSTIFRKFSPTADSAHRSIVTMEKGVHQISDGETSANIRVIISSTRDTVSGNIVRPLTSAIHDLRKQHKGNNFVIRISEDTLDIKRLETKFASTLALNEVDLPFKLTALKEPLPALPLLPDRREPRPRKPFMGFSSFYGDNFEFGPVVYSPINLYSIRFDHKLVTFLIAKLTTEIIFCFFLTVITCSAFFLIYKNLRKQQRLIEQKDEFINNVSHELKTPIATVSVALEALQNFGVANNPKMTSEYLAIAKSQIAHLSGITDKILNTSLLENARPYTFSHVDLKELAHEVLGTIRLLSNSADIRFTTHPEAEDFVVKGSHELLRSMIENLLENALKYSPEKPVIELSLRSTQSHIIIEVKDNGIGIPSEFREKIFEKFFRVPTGNVHNVKGFGLGLSYVASVVKLHRGKVEVKNNPGPGSNFIVSLPRNP